MSLKTWLFNAFDAVLMASIKGIPLENNKANILQKSAHNPFLIKLP